MSMYDWIGYKKHMSNKVISLSENGGVGELGLPLSNVHQPEVYIHVFSLPGYQWPISFSMQGIFKYNIYIVQLQRYCIWILSMNSIVWMYAILMMKLLFYYSLYDKTPRKVFTGQRAANNNGTLFTLPFYPIYSSLQVTLTFI